MVATATPGTERPPRWLRSAAEFGARHGWPRAQVTLGAMLEREPPVNINLARANELYRSAAARGNAQAMWNLGVNYLGTKGGERDTKQAIRWLTQACESRHGLATWALARMYLSGTLVEHNPKRGLKLLKRAALDGCQPAQEALVEVYEHGADGVPADRTEARRWIKRSHWHGRLMHRLGLQ